MKKGFIFVSTIKVINKMTASELKIGDTFKKQGYLFTVVELTNDDYKNGTENILVSCTTNGGKIVDSFFRFKPTTKIK